THVVVTGFKTAGCSPAGDSAASFTWRFGDPAGLAEVACCAGAAGFGAAARRDDLSCFDEPLNMSDSQPAWLASIGESTSAAIAAMIMPQRRQTPNSEWANFLPDNSNPGFPQSDSVRASRQHKTGSADFNPLGAP